MPPANLLTPSKLCSQEGVVQQPHHSLGRHIEIHLLQVELTAVQGCHRPLCLSPHLNIPATHKNIHFLSFFIHTHSLTSFSHTHSLTSCTYTHLSTLPPSTHTSPRPYSPLLPPTCVPLLTSPSSAAFTSPPHPTVYVHPHSHLLPPPIFTSSSPTSSHLFLLLPPNHLPHTYVPLLPLPSY